MPSGWVSGTLRMLAIECHKGEVGTLHLRRAVALLALQSYALQVSLRQR